MAPVGQLRLTAACLMVIVLLAVDELGKVQATVPGMSGGEGFGNPPVTFTNISITQNETTVITKNETTYYNETIIITKNETVFHNETVYTNQTVIQNETVFQNETIIVKNETVFHNETVFQNETVIIKNETIFHNETVIGGGNETISHNETVIINGTVSHNETVIINGTVSYNETVVLNTTQPSDSTGGGQNATVPVSGNSTVPMPSNATSPVSENVTVPVSGNSTTSSPISTTTLPPLDPDDMGSVFQHLAACYHRDNSLQSCNDTYGNQGADILECTKQVTAQISSTRQTFLLYFSEFQFRIYMKKCTTTYCGSKMDDCFYKMLSASLYIDHSTDLICNAKAGGLLATCMADISNSCYEKDTVQFYNSFLTIFCSNVNIDIQYLLSLATCYPRGALDVLGNDLPQACGDVKTKLKCKDTVSSAGCSDISKSLASQMHLRYASRCEPSLVCSNTISMCFTDVIDKFMTGFVDNSIFESYVCSSMTIMIQCFKSSPCKESYYQKLIIYLQTTCAPQNCRALIQDCYNNNKYDPESVPNGGNMIDMFCDANANLTDCLKNTGETCKDEGSSGGGEISTGSGLTVKLNELCTKRNESECYAQALWCLHTNSPAVIQPSIIRSAATENAICQNYNVTKKCMEEALTTCPDGTQYHTIVDELNTIISNQCVDDCSTARTQTCSSNFLDYCKNIWTKPAEMGQFCGLEYARESCYTYIAQRCSEGSGAEVNVKITLMQSVVIAIAKSCQPNNITIPATTPSTVTETTTTTPAPSGCDVEGAATQIDTFLVFIKDLKTVSANNSEVCEKWKSTQISITSLTTSCTGQVGDNIKRTVVNIDNVVKTVCNKSEQCQLLKTSECTEELSQAVTARTNYKPPTNFAGKKKPQLCRKCSCPEQPSNDDDDEVEAPPTKCEAKEKTDQGVEKDPFQWAMICNKIEKVKNCTMNSSLTCDSAIKMQLNESITTMTKDVVQDCMKYKNSCQPEKGLMCVKQILTMTLRYPAMSASDKSKSCSLMASYQQCVWNNLVRCTPQVYQNIWKAIESLTVVINCPLPKPDDKPPEPPVTPPVVPTPPCQIQKTTKCIVDFAEKLTNSSLQASDDSEQVCQDWTLTIDCIHSALASVANDASCQEVVKNTVNAVMHFEMPIDQLCSVPECYIEDAYSCLASLEYKVRSRGWLAPGSGIRYSVEQSQNTGFCSSSKKVLSCVRNATKSCDGKLISKTNKIFELIQTSTGLQCQKPCDLKPCLNGGVCTETPEGSEKPYMCQCLDQYSGDNCEIDQCEEKVFLSCIHSSFEALIDNSFGNFCSSLQTKKECIMKKTMNCPNTQIEIVNKVLEPVSKILKCEQEPVPPTGCEMAALVCIKQTFSSDKPSLWNKKTGKLDDKVCKKYKDVQACISLTNGCDSSNVAIESVTSLLCEPPIAKCDVPAIDKPVKNIEKGCKNAQKKKKPKKPKKSPEKEKIKKLCSKKRKPKCNHPEKKVGKRKPKSMEPQNDDDNQFENGFDDICWYIGNEIDKLNDTVSNCTDSWKDYKTKFIDDIKKRYLKDGQCDNPCDDNQCSNGAKCVPLDIGYKCVCPPGFKGAMCDQFVNDTCSVMEAIQCAKSLQDTVLKIANGEQANDENCRIIKEKSACVSMKLAACNSDVSFVSLDLSNVLIEKVVMMCQPNPPPVPKCELKAAATCMLNVSLNLLSQESTEPYCSVLAAGLKCASMINTTCTDGTEFSSTVLDALFSAQLTVCPMPECSLDTCLECIETYDEQPQDADTCSKVVVLKECVEKTTMKCPDSVKQLVLKYVNEDVMEDAASCVNPCDINPCLNDGVCQPSNDNSTDGFMCKCKKPFAGKICDQQENCNADAVEKCLTTVNVTLSNILSPSCSAEASCASLEKVKECIRVATYGCDYDQLEQIEKIQNSVRTLVEVCKSSESVCVIPTDTCKIKEVQECVTSYTKSVLLGTSCGCGTNFGKICRMEDNVKTSCLTTKEISGCDENVKKSIEKIVNVTSTIVGGRCMGNKTCETKEANKCIDTLKKKLDQIKKQQMCPLKRKPKLCEEISKAQMCVKENTKDCTDEWTKESFKQKLITITRETSVICPLPCNANPCTEDSECVPMGYDDYKCVCKEDGDGSDDNSKENNGNGNGNNGNGNENNGNGNGNDKPSKCYKEKKCPVNNARACIASLEFTVGAGKFFGNGIKKSAEFCKKIEASLKCTKQSFVGCDNMMTKKSFFAQIMQIEAAVGVHCISPCEINPCKNDGVCVAKGAPKSFPSFLPMKDVTIECKCLPGTSGKWCEIKNDTCDVKQVEMCLVNATSIFAQQLSGPSPTCKPPPQCPASKPECGDSGLDGLIELIGGKPGKACPQLYDCDLSALAVSCSISDLLSVKSWDNTSMSAGKEFCAKWTEIRRCVIQVQAGKCKAAVEALDVNFQFFCVENPVPECPIRDVRTWIVKLQADLILATANSNNTAPPPNNTSDGGETAPGTPPVAPPPPPPPPPPPAPAPSRVLSITAQGELSVYCDGKEQKLNDRDNVKTVKKVVIESSVTVVAIRVKNKMRCQGGGIIAILSGSSFITDKNCKCMSTEVAGWKDKDYDASAWASATEVQKTRCQTPDELEKAKWIWTSRNEPECFCRCQLPKPPAPPTPPPAPAANVTQPPPTQAPPPPKPEPVPPPQENQPPPEEACSRALEIIMYAKQQAVKCSDDIKTEVDEEIEKILVKNKVDKICADPCKDNKCRNGAECVPQVPAYTCKCKTGFSGKFCEIGGECDLTTGISVILKAKHIVDYIVTGKEVVIDNDGKDKSDGGNSAKEDDDDDDGSNEDPKPSSKPSSKEEPKPSSKPGSKEEPKPSSKPSSKEEPKPSSKPSSKEEPKPSSKPSSKEGQPNRKRRDASDDAKPDSKEVTSKPKSSEKPPNSGEKTSKPGSGEKTSKPGSKESPSPDDNKTDKDSVTKPTSQKSKEDSKKDGSGEDNEKPDKIKINWDTICTTLAPELDFILTAKVMPCGESSSIIVDILQPFLKIVLEACKRKDPKPPKLSCEIEKLSKCGVDSAELILTGGLNMKCSKFEELRKCFSKLSVQCSGRGGDDDGESGSKDDDNGRSATSSSTDIMKLQIDVAIRIERQCPPKIKCSFVEAQKCISEAAVFFPPGKLVAKKQCPHLTSIQGCVSASLKECDGEMKKMIEVKVLKSIESIVGFCSDPCIADVCLNGGVCIPAGLTYMCQCKAPYVGKRCEEKENCQPSKAITCIKNVTNVVIMSLLDPCNNFKCSKLEEVKKCVTESTSSCDQKVKDTFKSFADSFGPLKSNGVCDRPDNSANCTDPPKTRECQNYEAYKCINEAIVTITDSADSTAGPDNLGICMSVNITKSCLKKVKSKCESVDGAQPEGPNNNGTINNGTQNNNGNNSTTTSGENHGNNSTTPAGSNNSGENNSGSHNGTTTKSPGSQSGNSEEDGNNQGDNNNQRRRKRSDDKDSNNGDNTSKPKTDSNEDKDSKSNGSNGGKSGESKEDEGEVLVEHERALEFVTSLAADKCTSKCDVGDVNRVLALLKAQIDKFDKQFGNLLTILGSVESKNDICSDIERSVAAIVSDVIYCSDDQMKQSIEKLKIEMIRIGPLCPIPCHRMPCSKDAICKQIGYAEYKCECKDDSAPIGSCEKEPECKLNEAYECVNTLASTAVLKGDFNRAGGFITIPDDVDFCGEVNVAVECIKRTTKKCGSEAVETVTKTVLNIQKAVNRSCIDICDTNPCENGGVCTSTSDTEYTCQCPQAYTGESCEKPLCSVDKFSSCIKNTSIMIINGDQQGLCASISNTEKCVEESVANCTEPTLQSIRKELANSLKEEVTKICLPTPPPECDIKKLKADCQSDVSDLNDFLQKIRGSSQDDAEQDNAEFCGVWMSLESCLMMKDNCKTVLKKIHLTMGLTCEKPEEPKNDTCSIKRTETCLKSLDAKLNEIKHKKDKKNNSGGSGSGGSGGSKEDDNKSNGNDKEQKPSSKEAKKQSSKEDKDKKPKKPKPEKPHSCKKIKEKTLPPAVPPPPPEEVQDCKSISQEKNCTLQSVSQCGDDVGSVIIEIIKSDIKQKINETLGEDALCQEPCKENPCQNEGKCKPDDGLGFVCECVEGFEGDYCEKVPKCDESAALACLEILKSSEEIFSSDFLTRTCSSLSQKKACIAKNLMACSDKKKAFVHLAFTFLNSLETNCKDVKEPTCEQKQIYPLFSALVQILFPYPGAEVEGNPELCGSLNIAVNKTIKISSSCPDATNLSTILSDKFEGALDVYCPVPNCSFTEVSVCLDQIYEVIVSDDDNNTKCSAIIKKKQCVRDSSSMCDTAKTDLVQQALKELSELDANLTCSHPCDKSPCQHEGQCQIAGPVEYACQCTPDFTGKNCEIPRGCNKPELRKCLQDSKDILVQKMVDPCMPPLNCSIVDRLLLCIEVNTRSCDSSVDLEDNVDKIKASVMNLKLTCDVYVPPPKPAASSEAPSPSPSGTKSESPSGASSESPASPASGASSESPASPASGASSESPASPASGASSESPASPASGASSESPASPASGASSESPASSASEANSQAQSPVSSVAGTQAQSSAASATGTKVPLSHEPAASTAVPTVASTLASGNCGPGATTGCRRKRDVEVSNEDSQDTCEVSPDCDVKVIKDCYASFVDTAFTELTAECIVNHGRICRSLNMTVQCIEKEVKTCGDFTQFLERSVGWLIDLAGGSTCGDQPVCRTEKMDQGKKCAAGPGMQPPPANNGTGGSNNSTNPPPPADSSDMCVKVSEVLDAIEDNAEGCDSATRDPILAQVESSRAALNGTCSFPCRPNPCQNGGTCTQTSQNDYECKCVGEFAGKNCDQDELVDFENDTIVPCRADGELDANRIQLKIPIKFACDDIRTISIFKDGFITLDKNDSSSGQSGSATSPITDYSSLCDSKLNIVAPLFTKQDCTCSGSKITVGILYPSDQSPRKDKVIKKCEKSLKAAKVNGSEDFKGQVAVVITWNNLMPKPCSVYRQTYPTELGCTYQLLLVSDLKNTYAQFIYGTCTKHLDPKNTHMGVTNMRGECQSDYKSGTDQMGDIASMNGTSGKKGSWIYSLSEKCLDKKQQPEDQCLDWVTKSVDLGKEKLDPCACSSVQASKDPRYHLNYVDWFRTCYQVNRIAKIVKNNKLFQVKQTCCYDPFNKGSLFTSLPYSGGCSVISGQSDDVIDDTEAYNQCCVKSNKYCGIYEAMRPSGKCNKYALCMLGFMFGDPHVLTTDNKRYTFNGVGEFTMIQTLDNSYTMQARTAQMIGSDGKPVAASAYSAFAAQERGTSKIQVELNELQNGLIFYVDDVKKIPTSQAQIYSSDIYISASNTQFNATFPSGWTMSVGVGLKMLSISQTVPGSAFDKTRGLMGRYNTDSNDDFTAPDGTVLSPTASIEEIHEFGMKWQVSAAESLFTYLAGKTFEDFQNPNFKPAFEPPCVTDAEKKTGADTCDGNEYCLFDYCVTKDIQIALQTKKMIEDFDANRAILMNKGPELTIRDSTPSSDGIYSIQATVGTELSFILDASSTEHVKINIEMLGNVSKETKVSLSTVDATETSTSSLFKWTPTSLNPVDVTFIAVDSMGAVSARLHVIVTICNGCSKHGTCMFSASTPIYNGTAYRLAQCSCYTGWTGTAGDCSEDYNGCVSNQCSSPAACTDLTPDQQAATGLAFSCSSCPEGFNTEQCIDINECQQLPRGSKCHYCINQVGSYTCRCLAGYRPTADGKDCEDIDECAEQTSGCTQACVNTEGSFSCACLQGYTGPNCDPITACGPNQCSYKCAVLGGVQKCSCQSGFTIASDGNTCIDIDECSNPDFNKCSVKSQCSNTVGGYKCGCADGTKIGQDLRTCEPCSDTTWGPNCANSCNCGPGVKSCSRTTGCTVCHTGWMGNNCTQDVDECSTGAARCQAGATCINTVGTYFCRCADGSGGNCYAAADISTPCPPSYNNFCQHGGSCYLDSNNNRPTCKCPSGYGGDVCDVKMSEVNGARKANIGLIVGLSILGAILLIVAAALIYFCCIRPRSRPAKYESAPSDISDEDKNLAKFDQNSKRISKFWPHAPQRYAPHTYAPQDEGMPEV